MVIPYISIAPVMNVGKSAVIETVQDVVESLFDLRNEYIKFPETEQELNSRAEQFLLIDHRMNRKLTIVHFWRAFSC